MGYKRGEYSTTNGLTEKCCTGDGACEIHGCEGRHQRPLKGLLVPPDGDYIRRSASRMRRCGQALVLGTVFASVVFCGPAVRDFPCQICKFGKSGFGLGFGIGVNVAELQKNRILHLGDLLSHGDGRPLLVSNQVSTLSA